MNTFTNQKSDVLREATRMLSEPGRDTRRKILMGMNVVFIIAMVLHTIIQLVNTGTLPDPARDMIFFPLIIIINTVSLLYNFSILRNESEGNRRKDALTAWSSIGVAMLLALSIVHANENLATSMLVDFGFSVVILFIVGTVLGRRAAIVWFVISGLSLYFAYQNVGTDFEYNLMTSSEIAQYKSALESGDPAALQRMEEVKQEHLVPLPSGLYASVWFIFMTIAFLAVFFESNMISKVLGVIPNVIEKINIASQQKHQLEQDNMRMGMELDVARKIQKMMLPKDDEFLSVSGLDIAARMDPASEVGGDFYEFLPQKDGSIICAMGDVTDHGLQSGLVMLMAQSTIRTVIDDKESLLSEAMNRINTIMYRNIHGRMNDHRNLTLSLARLNHDSLTVCGQHENLYYFNSALGKGEIISTEDLGIYVGLIEDIADHVKEKSFSFREGDIYMFYTDGLTEAENENGELYGEQRLLAAFERAAEGDSQSIVKHIYDEVYHFMNGQSVLDDITLMVIKKNGQA